MLSAVFAQQAKLDEANWQVASGKRAPTYQGLAADSGRLLRLETSRITFDRLARSNEANLRRLDIGEKALTAIDGSMRGFREVLMTVGGSSPLKAEQAQEIQLAAFRAMTDVQAFLNTQADGRFLFSGSRAVTRPVDLGLSDLAAFQNRYDGIQTLYPPTRDSHLGADLTLTSADTGGLIISGGNTIAAANTAAVPSPFAQIAVGATITLAGSSLGNSGSYTVVAKPSPHELVVSGTLSFSAEVSLDVQATLADGPESAAATLSMSRWYKGDEQAHQHRVDDQRLETFDLNAVDPAFEKALRAFGLIAQGVPGSQGDLAHHPERIGWAIDLINQALERAPSLPAPFGSERLGNLDDVRRELGFQQSLLHETRSRQDEFVATLEIKIAETENADPNEASARLLSANAALEAAYKAISLVRQLSLVKFL
jgi:flagellin-like hook-associated protein FlgL